jgi:hypothetical protein
MRQSPRVISEARAFASFFRPPFWRPFSGPRAPTSCLGSLQEF